MSAHADQVIVPEARIPVVKEVDVLVCGAGVASALAVEESVLPRELDIAMLHAGLKEQNCVFLQKGEPIES